MLDELLHYLVEEMAMDGEEGCSVARLDGFIDSYYARRRSQFPTEPIQYVDNSYKNFVWRKLCQLQNVRLGVLEPSVASHQLPQDNLVHEPDPRGIGSLQSQSTDDTPKIKSLQLPIVASNAANKMTQRPNRLTKSVKRRSTNEAGSNSKYIEPVSSILSIGQIRALETGKVQKSFQSSQTKRIKLDKANSKSTVSPAPSAWRQLDSNLGSLSRDELIAQFGLDEDGQSRLKIAVDPMTCWKAVVGTDTRSPKLTPFVYQVLSIVAQGREAGATVMELGQKLKHDQKSLFHFVKVLTDLQLVAKFRAYQHKAWTNRVVHRRYLATSEWYKNSIKKDEISSTPSSIQIPPLELDDYNLSRIEPPYMTAPSPNNGMGTITGDPPLHVLTTSDPTMPVMSPINREILAVNETLIKSRMFTVLKRSPNNTMVHADIIKAIGIENPTKDERRRLNRMIDSYVKRGLLERVAIANVSGHTPCIRLTNLGEESMNLTSIGPKATDVDTNNEEVDEELSAIPITRSIGQTIFDLVESSGQEGITYKILCHKLNDIEVRTVEQILNRMEREQPPPHLSHLKVTSVLETFGREKRVRWFSTESLKSKCQTSGIQLPSDGDNLKPGTGGFVEINPSTIDKDFYANSAQLYSTKVPELKGCWGKPAKKTSAINENRGKSVRLASTVKNKNSMKGIGGTETATTTPTNEHDAQKFHNVAESRSNSTSDTTTILPAKRVIGEISLAAEPRKRSRLNSGEHTPTTMAMSLPIAEELAKLPSESVIPPAPTNAPELLPDSSASSTQVPHLTNPVSQLKVTTQTDLCAPCSPFKTRISRQNLTSLRREYHLLEAIKFAGGIVEKSNELSKAVRDLVDRVDQDHIVSLMDNRTLNCTLHGLEVRGEVKLSTVIVTDALGASCQRKIVYLPSIQLDGAEMRDWLNDLKVRFKTLDKATESRVHEHKDFASPIYRLTRKPITNQPPLPNGLGVNDEALQAAFLNQWRCLSQLYGFILGKAARAKILHLHLLRTFQNASRPSASRLVITSGHRVFSSSFLFQELPVGVFAKLVPIMTKSEEFEQVCNIPGALETPMGNSSLAIRRLFQMGNQFCRVKVYQIVEVLCHLKLVVPLQKTLDISEFYRKSENGETCYYSPTTMCTSVGLFGLANEGFVYDFKQRMPNPITLLSKWPLQNELDGETFWEELKRSSIPNPNAPPTRNDVGSVEEEQLFRGPPKILQLLTDQSKWRDSIQLTPTQREYIVRYERQTSSSINLESDHSVISHIAQVLVTAPEAVKQAIKEFRENVALSRAKKARKAKLEKKCSRKKPAEVNPEELKSAQEEAARVLSDKAKNVLKQKEVDWNSLINRFKAQSGISEIEEEVLRDLHTLFTTNNGGINATQVESELAAWLKRKQAAEISAQNQVEADKELVEIETTIGSSKRDTLPMLPSTKAKRIKMLNVNPRSCRLKTKKERVPRMFPEKPKKIGSVAANAIQPQSNLKQGARPSPIILRPSRRIRIEWDEALDDFLRDMVAIMKARAFATSAHVLPWPITRQVFKGIKTHILRNRYAKMERDPKEKRYLDLLTEAWTQVYFDKRGKVPELEDPMPHIPACFNGELALDYLRSNVDKAYLRSQVNTLENNQEATTNNKLPATYSELRSKYSARRLTHPRRSECWDEFYSLSNAIVRETNILTEALSARSQATIAKCRSVPHEVLRAAEAIKLLTSTPIKTYSEPIAATVLSHYPDKVLVRATDYLCMKGVIAVGGKLHYKKRLPGRSYCYTDKYLSLPQTRALQEPRDICLARLRNQSTSSPDGTIVWSLFASDTETASLLHAYSRGEVSLEADLTPNRAKRWESSTFYRSRKLDDHCIENVVKFKFKESTISSISSPLKKEPTSIDLELVDKTVIQAGAEGITPQRLMEQLSTQISLETLVECIETLTKMETAAKIYWACNEENALLLSCLYLKNWAEKVYLKKIENSNASTDKSDTSKPKKSDDKSIRIVEKNPPFLVPRLWFDLSGNLVENLFKLSLNRVENTVLTLPGIPYLELRRRTKLQLNILELDDILEELIRLGRIIHLEYHHYLQTGPILSRWNRGFHNNNNSHFWIPP